VGLSAAAADLSRAAPAVRQPARSRTVRYGIALATMALGVAGAEALEALTGPEFYAPLIGAAALGVWFGGIGPALVAVAGGWGYELNASVDLDRGLGESETRWLAGLAVALAVVWVTSAMRIATARSAQRAAEATRAGREVERLQALASQLSAAATPAEVARALVERGTEALGAHGGELALVVGDELELVDAEPGETGVSPPRRRLQLAARTVLAEAARSGEACWAGSRAELGERFPDEREHSAAVAGAIAVPVLQAGEVVGAVSFAFGDDAIVDEEKVALARVAADLGGQALERAQLFEDERSLREGLDRALRVAPRAGGGSPEEVAAGICREARRTFGADVALMLSILDEERFAVDWREPPSALATPGLRLPIQDLPDLGPAIERGTVMWVPDLLESLQGEALEIARTLGTVSALRIPIALGGRGDRVLVLQWETRVADPPPTALALARRFADQAGLALEEAERRAAEELAGQRADEARRLLETTTALAAAASTRDVVDIVLDHGGLAVGADAGVVALRERDELVVVGTAGVEADEVIHRLPLAESLPLADAVRRNELVVVESADDLRRRYPLGRAWAPLSHPASISVPLASRGAAIGGLSFGFDRPRRVDEAQRQLVSAIARQASAAFERARLHESEHSARSRVERSAARLAQLHALGIALGRARTEGEVAEAVGRQITGVLGARSAALYVAEDGSGTLRSVGRLGPPFPAADDEVAGHGDAPVAVAARTGEPVWSDGEVDARTGPGSWGVVPMIVEARTIGVLAVGVDDASVLDDDARRFVETVARYAGQPLERVRLLEGERLARRSAEQASRRTGRLQAASEALAAAVSVSEVAATVLEQARLALGSDAGLLYLRARAGDHAALVASAGLAPEQANALSRLDLSGSSPVAELIESGMRLVELRPAGQVARAHPAFAALLPPSFRHGIVCVPIYLGSVTGGAVLLAPAGPSLDGEDSDLLLALGGQTAQALERARLLETEQASVFRLQRLHAITAALSRAVTVEDVGRATLDEAVAAVGASEGAVVLRSGADTVELVAVLGRADTMGALSLERPLSEVIRTGHPCWELEGVPQHDYPLPRRATDRLGGWAALPLAGTSGVVGALVLGFDEGRALDEDDRAWLLAVAGQCAQAIERSRLYDVERTTRTRIERLQQLTARLSTALTPSEVASAVLSAGRSALNAVSAALVSEDGGTFEVLGLEGAPPEMMDVLLGAGADETGPLGEAMRSQRSVYVEDGDALSDRYPHAAPLLARLGDGGWAIAPLLVEGRAVAALYFGWSQPQAFPSERRLFIETLARQCALALDRARKHQSERQIAETLQRSMLPDRLPDVPGVELAARYVPGTAGMEVGGDWFDAMLLENGRLGLAVGDVVGKGVKAASTMGQLRNALRAFALDQLRPDTTVGRLNALVDTYADVPFATLVYLTLDPGRRVCRYTTAGHLPPLVLRPDGTVERLEGGRSLPLGVDANVEFAQSTAELEPGAAILLYTDGLVERPGESLEDGLQRLEASLRGTEVTALGPGALADRVLTALLAGSDPRDDVALLVVKLAAASEDRPTRGAPGGSAGDGSGDGLPEEPASERSIVDEQRDRIEKPSEDPKPPDPNDQPEPPKPPGGGSVRPGGSPADTPGVESPLKD
jgi:GAF domain-containing protein